MTFLRVEHFDLRVFSKYILPLDPGVPAGHRQRLVDGASLRLQLRGRRQVQAAQAKVGHSARPRSQWNISLWKGMGIAILSSKLYIEKQLNVTKILISRISLFSPLDPHHCCLFPFFFFSFLIVNCLVSMNVELYTLLCSVSDPDPFWSVSFGRVRIRIHFKKRWSGSGQQKINSDSHTNQPKL